MAEHVPPEAERAPAEGQAEAEHPAEHDSWVTDTRASYDTVAESYAEHTRDLLDRTPEERAALAVFAAQVRDDEGGPVADVGCGTGRVTAHLHGLEVDAYGIDLSPRMVEVARVEYPGLRFEVGSMTELDVGDSTLAGLVAWYSLIHVPDDEIPRVLARFRRALRPGAPLLLGFHVGDTSQSKTEGYGGHPMRIRVHRRRPERMAGWLDDTGFTVETSRTVVSAESTLGGILLARRRSDGWGVRGR